MDITERIIPVSNTLKIISGVNVEYLDKYVNTIAMNLNSKGYFHSDNLITIVLVDSESTTVGYLTLAILLLLL